MPATLRNCVWNIKIAFCAECKHATSAAENPHINKIVQNNGSAAPTTTHCMMHLDIGWGTLRRRIVHARHTIHQPQGYNSVAKPHNQ
jgi:hypothetical protein